VRDRIFQDVKGKKPSGKWRTVEPLEELRQYPRFRVKCRANVFGLETWMQHPLTNLSVGGACVTVPSPSPVGEIIKLELLECEGAPGVSLECEVKWCSERQMGVEFRCGTANEDVRRYLNIVRTEVVPDERDA
jgi:hypothetical protein